MSRNRKYLPLFYDSYENRRAIARENIENI